MNRNQYFSDKIETLPDDLQFAILTSGWEKSLAGLQKKYKLHLDQGQILEAEAVRLMFGDIDATDFINTMFNEGHISTQVAADILLDIDAEILKKIRETVELYVQSEENDAKVSKMLKTEEELDAEEKAEIYAQYYANVANILEKTEEETKRRGFLPDGSNITDEDMAEAMGVTVDEYRKQSEVGALEAAQTSASPEIPTDISREKEELLRELEAPQRSFAKPIPPAPAYKLDHEPLAPDHQLENTHIEPPYHAPDPVIEIKVEEPTPAPEPVKPITPEIKKPTKITLTSDAYREPIE